jgi:hypothetical protein
VVSAAGPASAPVAVAVGDVLVVTVDLGEHTMQVHGTVEDVQVSGAIRIRITDPNMVVGPPGRSLL